MMVFRETDDSLERAYALCFWIYIAHNWRTFSDARATTRHNNNNNNKPYSLTPGRERWWGSVGVFISLALELKVPLYSPFFSPTQRAKVVAEVWGISNFLDRSSAGNLKFQVFHRELYIYTCSIIVQI